VPAGGPGETDTRAQAAPDVRAAHPGGALVDPAAMEQSLLPSLGLVALVVAMIITLYDMASALRPSTCPECSHCRAIAAAAAREQERLNSEYARRIGLDEDDDHRRLG
jgi:hypothetical protein